MSPRYARLARDWLLRGWSDTPCVAIHWRSGDQRELGPRAFYVAGSCDGRTNFDSPAFLPEHQAVLDTLIGEGIAEPCLPGAAVEVRQQYRKATNPRVTSIDWCVTGRCNLACRHCYMRSPSGRYGERPLHDMCRLIDQFERANVLEVSLTGGEPFRRADLTDIMTVLAQARIRVNRIYSNGLLITNEILDKIKRLGHSPDFQISFDGYGGHEYMRGKKGIENAVISAIRRVRSAGFRVIVATSVDRVTIGRLEDTYELLRGLDVQFWRIGAPQKTGNWSGATTAVSLDEEASGCERVLERWLADKRPFGLLLGLFYRSFGRVDPAGGEEPDLRFVPDDYDCGSCREHPNLLPDGTLLPCTGYVGTIVEKRMPNLFREDLSAVWTSSVVRDIADITKRDLLAMNPQCGDCGLFATCGMGCRASAVTVTGDLMAPDPAVCELWKRGYRQRFRDIAERSAARG